ncbi:MAG: hypothetical protein Q8941_07460 [Bacteroidota bacterium]|nr:hypothetical protein [Bacteroidota bacterium]
MKKFPIVASMIAITVIFYNCHSAKKATSSVPPPPPYTYETNLKVVIAASCSPCHISGKGNKKPYDNFANVKTDIDEMIRRIQLNPSDKGFMPFRKAAKLSDSTIAVFTKWKADGLIEK